MRKVILLIAFAFALLSSKAQYAKAVYAQIGGPGIASANFDMRLTHKEDGLGFRVGVGGFKVDEAGVFLVPVGLNYLIGKDGKNYFEIGAGFTYLHYKDTYDIEDNNFSSSFGNLTFGYRLAPAKGGFFFKAEITPVFGKGFFIPYYGGIGFGYKF